MMTEDVETIDAAWALYELTERELWDEFAEDPTFPKGQGYIHGERLARKRRERAIQRLRYQRQEATGAIA